jgi:hypothetical protein
VELERSPTPTAGIVSETQSWNLTIQKHPGYPQNRLHQKPVNRICRRDVPPPFTAPVAVPNRGRSSGSWGNSGKSPGVAVTRGCHTTCRGVTPATIYLSFPELLVSCRHSNSTAFSPDRAQCSDCDSRPNTGGEFGNSKFVIIKNTQAPQLRLEKLV